MIKVPSQDRVQQRRILLANAFLSGLWSRTSISQSRLSSRSLTLLRSSSSAGPADEDFIGFFALFSVGKKVRVPPRVRVRSCPGRSAHGLRRPVVRMCGLSSTTTSKARLTTGTDVLVFPPGSLLRASRSSGSASGTLRGRSTTGTGKHVPVLGTSLLFLLADGLRSEGLGIPSPHLGCHSRRRQRRHVQGWCCWSLPLRAVLLPVGARARCLACPVVRPRCAASWPFWTRRTLYWQWHVQGWYCCHDVPVVFLDSCLGLDCAENCGGSAVAVGAVLGGF